MTDAGLPAVVDLESELATLADRQRRAGGPLMRVINLAGRRAEHVMARLPAEVRRAVDGSVAQALRASLRAAQRSRGVIPDQTAWRNTVVASGLGAAGGLGGLPSALAELPVTVTLLFRAIAAVAAEHGFEPAEPDVQAMILSVFESAGPLASDDGADTGFLAVRVTLTGGAVHKAVAAIAPRLATVLGQKLAAQTVPVLGAAAGAATNYAYIRYYQEVAHVVFGLRRLERDTGRPYPALVAALDAEMKRQKPHSARGR